MAVIDRSTDEYSFETHYVVYNDRTGEMVKVRPDRDGLGLIEIIAGDNNIVLTLSQADYVREALQKLVEAE